MSIHVCDHCGKAIPDEATFCPYCGAELAEDIRLTRIPETIGELRDFCAAHKMPLDAMRFFIGEDFRGARAFGIYKKPDGTCVVYKNKADGSRAVRYEGPDEKRAVRELYEKLKSETDLRRGAVGGSRSYGEAEADGGTEPADDAPVKPWEVILGGLFYFWKPIVIVLAIVLAIHFYGNKPDRGYYRYQDDTYYYQDSGWYLYDVFADDWSPVYDVPAGLEDNYDDYYESWYYDDGYGAADFSDSDYYDYDYDYDYDDYGSGSSYDDFDWDWDWDSGFDSWDSFDTDWDSDW